MIGRIHGTLLERKAPELLIDVQGVGYEVLVSLNTFFDLPAPGQAVTLHTHFVVREDVQQLYGFVDTIERELFRSLIRVSGVGPKMALAILSGMTAADFAHSVQHNDTATLVRLPGVGKKTAERLIVEMRDRLNHFSTDSADSSVTGPAGRQTDTVREAESALIALGYKPQEAAKAISKVAEEGMSSETLIRLALRNMIPA